MWWTLEDRTIPSWWARPDSPVIYGGPHLHSMEWVRKVRLRHHLSFTLRSGGLRSAYRRGRIAKFGYE